MTSTGPYDKYFAPVIFASVNANFRLLFGAKNSLVSTFDNAFGTLTERNELFVSSVDTEPKLIELFFKTLKRYLIVVTYVFRVNFQKDCGKATI